MLTLIGTRKPRKEKPWNRCDYCGKFIALREFEIGMARRRLVTEDTAFSAETYSTVCGNCRQHYQPRA